MSRIFKAKKMTSFQIIILGFASVILLGTILLMLPISSKEHVFTSFGDSLFTATSSVCVTGLVVKDTATYWSYFGQFIILILIQIGGLGVITIASFLAMLAGKKISLMQRQTIQNSLAAPQVGGVMKLIKFVLKISIIIEGAGVLALLPVFVKRYGLKGIWMSVFHSVSAFCNAGFDLMGDKTGQFSSLTSFGDDTYVMVVFSLLIVIGGIGFLTWDDIVTKKLKFSQYRMQSKVILVTTFVLILVPFIIFFTCDFAGQPFRQRFCSSLFQAVTPRTAGFNSVDFGTMTEAGQSIIMILMIIGGSPGSTAGGMKTTTLAILVANAIAVFKEKKNAKYFGRRIEDSVVKSASTIFFMYISFSLVAALIINMAENIPIHQCLFETMSAIGTVGLTLGITPGLGAIARIVLIVLMFIGRVGGLTVIYAAFSKKDSETSKFPVENIMVG